MENVEEIKRINIKEFRELGYLQELNRKFSHPLGLALEVLQDANGDETLGGIWDFREDLEGIHYDINNSEEDRKLRFKEKIKYVENEFESRFVERYKSLGFIIEKVK